MRVEWWAMKAPFSVQSVLLWAAYVAIMLGGWGAAARWTRPIDFEGLNLPMTVLFYGIFWLPFAILGYVAGRRTPTVRSMFVFAVLEFTLIALVVFNR